MDNAQTAVISTEQVDTLRELGYCIVKQAVPRDMIAVLENYARMQRFNNYYLDDANTNSLWRYADVMGESLLLHLQPLMEKISGCGLYPTNSVLRIYRNGGILKKHLDRPTCEYSATLTIGYDAASLYPIWVQSKNESVPVYLDRGDMLIYKGCEVPHWRETFTGQNWIQLFLHYVDAKGKFSQYKNDGRIMIGMNSGKVLIGKQQG
jgi:hypothetical protein